MEVPFHLPAIGDEEIAAVTEVMRSGWLTSGPRTKRFEEEFAAHVGARHAVGVFSCTSAMLLALEAAGVGPGDVVATSPMTFASTAEVIMHRGARPLFVDIEPDTMNMNPLEFERAVERVEAGGGRLKAVMPVHLAGHPCEMDTIMKTARDRGIMVIEDAAHMLPGAYRGRRIGTIGDAACFSFYATKNITTGEGGMFVTDNDEWAARVRLTRQHGVSRDSWGRYSSEGSWRYDTVALGQKCNLTDVCSAMGLVQLKRSDELYRRRRSIAMRYTEAFGAEPMLEVPTHRPEVDHSWHLYVLRLNLDVHPLDRATFITALRNRGIHASVHFIPLHLHSFFADALGHKPGDFPVALAQFERCLSIPLYPAMTDAQVDVVIDAVLEISRRG